MVSCVFMLDVFEAVPKNFPNVNVVSHLVVPADWGSCMLRLADFLVIVPGLVYEINLKKSRFLSHDVSLQPW